MGSPKGWNIIKKGSRADYQRSHHTLIDSLKKRQSSIVDCNTHPWPKIYSYFWITEILRRRKKEQTEAKASIVGFEKGWVGGFEKTWLPKSG